jgi:hypothetical protein
MRESLEGAGVGAGEYSSHKDVPVLLMVFKRPAHTTVLLNQLRKIGVRQIYVSSDAANREEDEVPVDEVRKILGEGFDWDCSVSFNFREENRGLRDAVTSSIDWFFSNVKEGIILEDDCVPSEDFFRLCASLLPRFRNDSRIMHIAGDNTADISIEQDWSYCFVRYPHIWGWATWKSAWKLYDRDLEMWADFKACGMTPSVFGSDAERRVWEPIYNRLLKSGIPDTWDWQWSASLAMHDGLAVQPIVNLVSNTGFGPQATHTKKPGKRSNRRTGSLGVIKHPSIKTRHVDAERQIFSNTHKELGSSKLIRFLKTQVRKVV